MTAVEVKPVPLKFFAATTKLYSVPFVKPLSVVEVDVPETSAG